MLELEVYPERGLGNETIEFTLGMPFQFAVTALRKHMKLIKQVQVIYSDAEPLGNDLVISLPLDGVRLIFNSHSQTLKVIEVFDLRLLNLKYCGIMFSSRGVLPNIEEIDHCFGATHPGVYDPDNQVFVLNFRGLQFSFPIETRIEPQYVMGLGSIQFPTSPKVAKMFVYTGNSLISTSSPEMPLHCYYGNVFAESVRGMLKDSLICGLCVSIIKEGAHMNSQSTENKQRLERIVKLGESGEKVISALGAPNRIFYKSNDKMKIHAKRETIDDSSVSPYFLNYFTLGIDILIDGRSHKVKKFILHTNYPSHYNFNIYHRCNFQLTVPLPNNTEQLQLTPYSKWDDLQESFVCKKPVILNRSSSVNNTNPFGPTFCYSTKNLIFEVMSNNHIASVTIFQPVSLA